MLHFLLESSVSPTNADYCLPDHLEPLVERQQRDNFDWKAYLMEGIEIPSFYDSTSEEVNYQALKLVCTCALIQYLIILIF